MSLNPRAGQNRLDNCEWCRRLRRMSAHNEKTTQAVWLTIWTIRRRWPTSGWLRT